MTTQCQIHGCTRSASGRYTRPMFAASEGEEWPDDVSQRPVCWVHYWLEEGGKAAIMGGTAVVMFWILYSLSKVIA